MNNSTQRNSSSSPQEQADNNLTAGEGLDVTACSASSCVACQQVPTFFGQMTNWEAREISWWVGSTWLLLLSFVVIYHGGKLRKIC